MDRRSAPLLASHLRLEISSCRTMSSITVTAVTAASTITQPQLSMAAARRQHAATKGTNCAHVLASLLGNNPLTHVSACACQG